MKDDDALLAGLDIGTTRIKARLVDGTGAERGHSVVATPFSGHPPAGVDMSLDALQAALAAALAGLGERCRRVEAIGIAGLAESGAPLELDREGARPLGPIIAWHDPRGAETVARLEQHYPGGGQALAARIGQGVRTVSSAAKLGWLLGQGMRRPDRWLGVPELGLFLLTGQQATEYSLAARTGWYDVVERCHLPEIAQLLGVSRSVFPETMAAGSVMGRVSTAGGAWSGLPPGIPVTIAGHDHLVGVEALDPGQADLVNSVGTAETLVRRWPVARLRSTDIERALALRLAVTVRPGGESWAVLASAARAGLILGSVAQALGRSVAELDDLAEEVPNVVDGSAVDLNLDLDALTEALKSGTDPELPAGPPGEVWKAVLGALAQRTFASAGRMAVLLGPAQRVIVFGGGSRSAPWLAAKALLAGAPVLRVKEAEMVARGAAIFAGVAAQWWTSVGAAPSPSMELIESDAFYT